jgi:nucleoside-diphosphate-sugar epimerase
VADRTALVTGAAGFIGGHLSRRLAMGGWEVVALDRRPPAAELDLAGLRYHRIDVRDAGRVAELMKGVDTVFHLASIHLEVGESASVFEDVNVGAVRGIVSASARAGVRRFVHTSSVGIYGHVTEPPADESAPKNPGTTYERTKLRGEEAALQTAAERDVDLVVVRPAWVYGPGCPRTAKLSRALRKGRFFYIGDGSNLRHPLFIDDMVDAFLAATDAPERARGKAYIIGGPRYMPLREMVETFARVLSVPPPRLTVPARLAGGLGLAAEFSFGLLKREPPFSRRSITFFENDNAFDTSAAARDLGFQARVDLEEGLRRTFGANGMKPA